MKARKNLSISRNAKVFGDTLTKYSEYVFAYSCVSEQYEHLTFISLQKLTFSLWGFAPPPNGHVCYAKNVNWNGFPYTELYGVTILNPLEKYNY